MKNIYLSFFLMLFVLGSTFSQSRHPMPTHLKQQLYKELNVPNYQGAVQEEAIPFPEVSTSPLVQTRTVSQEIGQTKYDLQTNSSMQTRIINKGNDELSVTYTLSINDAAGAYTDRGTGYVTRNSAGDWTNKPSVRVEQTGRTGWPALGSLADGTDVVCAHYSPKINDRYVLNFMKKNGLGWTETMVPDKTPTGVLWPKMAVGGSDGNSVHVIAITEPAATSVGSTFEGEYHEGIDGHVLYYRSIDGGTNWDVTDFIIPGIDSTEYTTFGADCYAIDASGNNIAVAVFPTWGDVRVSVSNDNGTTWTTHTVYDFPLDKYSITDGYDHTDIPDELSLEGDSLSIWTSDESGAVLIDGNGNVHVSFSQHYVRDDNFTDESWDIYSIATSMRYWNESFGTDSTQMIGYLLDANGDGEFNLPGGRTLGTTPPPAGGYGQAYVSWPTMGMDADGNIYVVYSAVTEDYMTELGDDNLNQLYRHIFGVASDDGGATWSLPHDLIQEEFAGDFEDLYSFIEAVFPSMAKNVEDEAEIIFMLDYEPGLGLATFNEDPVGDNYIYHWPIDKNYFFEPLSTEVVSPEYFDFKLSPNPTKDLVNIEFTLKEKSTTEIGLFDLHGRQLKSLFSSELSGGTYNLNFNVSDLSTGIYFVRTAANGTVATSKLVVQ